LHIYHFDFSKKDFFFRPHTRMRTHEVSSVSPDTSVGTQRKVSGGFPNLSISRIHFMEIEMH